MANSFRTLKRNCPICSGARRDCRENTQTRLIHCRYNAVGSAPGFRFVGTDALGFNMWAVDDGKQSDEAEWQEMRQQLAADRERRRRSEAEHFAQLLSASERDRNIRKIHAQVGLTTRHRQSLGGRRLTDAEIDAGKFFSIAPWQEVSGIDPRLAGVDLYGRKLTIGQSGFACPIWDVERRIIGWQTRFDDDTEGGKYRWPTSQNSKRPNGGTAHLQNGELPISCCRPVGEVKRRSIGLAEGFLKSYITAQRQGQIVIGAAGANFAGSPQQLKSYLDELSVELGTKTAILYPDGGASANNSVMEHYRRAIQMVTEWGYSVEVAWWGQVDKTHPDIDELSDSHEIAYLPPEEFLELGGREKRTGHSFSGLFGWLPRFKSWLEKPSKMPWGFGRKGEVEVEPNPTPQEAPKYDQGERLDVWSSANHLGYRHILDTSTTGLGKSFDAGRLNPEMFPSARQIIYISKEHRNPTTPTLKVWPDMEARHDGVYRDEFGKLRRVDKGQPYVVPPNCGRNKTIGALRAKNIPGADTAKLVCSTCHNLELCQAGVVFGFLRERAEALKQPRFRAHPASLPSPSDYDYQQVVLVWEEASEILKAHRSIKVKAADISRTIVDLASKSPETFDTLRPLLTALHLHLSGDIKQPNKYGWGDAEVRQQMPDCGNLDLDAIREALRQHPETILNNTQEYGVDLADLRRNERKKFSASDETTAGRIASELALNWLPAFLEVLLGHEIGSLRIEYGTLTMTLGDLRMARIAQAASCNIYLDATTTASDLALPLGLADLEQILTVQQRTQPLDNVELVQVTTFGRLGLSQRSDYCQDRVDATVAQILKDELGETAVFDFKRHTEKGDGKRHWWVDDRGINDLETCLNLILTGTPCPNLGDLEAEFTVLYGRAPREGTERIKYPVQVKGQLPPDLQPYFEMEVSADPEFRSFCRCRILAAYHQAIGRLRAHRRPGEKLKVYILADYPLDFPVRLVKASQITPEAATKVERVEMALRAAVAELKATGQKITQSAVAAMTRVLDPKGKGYSQQHVSRYWGLLKTLLDDSNSKMSKTNEPPPDPNEAQWVSGEYLPLLAESPKAELLDGVLGVFEAYGAEVWRKIWDAVPATAQIKILKTLLLTLPASELRELALAAGGTNW